MRDDQFYNLAAFRDEYRSCFPIDPLTAELAALLAEAEAALVEADRVSDPE